MKFNQGSLLRRLGKTQPLKPSRGPTFSPYGKGLVLSERLHPAPADPRRDYPAWAAGLSRPRSRTTIQPRALTASFRREAFAANASAAAHSPAPKRRYLRRV